MSSLITANGIASAITDQTIDVAAIVACASQALLHFFYHRDAPHWLAIASIGAVVIQRGRVPEVWIPIAVAVGITVAKRRAVGIAEPAVVADARIAMPAMMPIIAVGACAAVGAAARRCGSGRRPSRRGYSRVEAWASESRVRSRERAWRKQCRGNNCGDERQIFQIHTLANFCLIRHHPRRNVAPRGQLFGLA